MYQSNQSLNTPRATFRELEFLENLCSNAPPPGKLPDFCFNFSVATIMLLKLCMLTWFIRQHIFIYYRYTSKSFLNTFIRNTACVGLCFSTNPPRIPNRPLALRGHVTNASLKQWVVILLMPKIDRTNKNYLTPEIWEEMHLREIFYGTLVFQQSSMICIGRHVGGHALSLQHGGQNYFLLISW